VRARSVFLATTALTFSLIIATVSAHADPSAVPIALSTTSPQVTEVPLSPHMPSIDGQAGAGLPTEQGQYALFGNPAGFSSPTLTFTALSTGAWLMLRPAESLPTLWNLLASANLGLSGIAGNLSSEYGAQGLGAGASALIGLSGKGFGIGLSAVSEAYFYGPNLTALAGEVQSEIALTGGFALRTKLFGSDFSIGIDARPFARIHAVLDSADSERVLSQVVAGNVSLGLLNTVPTLNGYGVAFDTGVQLKSGALTFGLQARDIGGTRINYAAQDFQTVLDYIGRGGLPPTTYASVANVSAVDYVVPMRIAAGLSYQPDFGSVGRFFRAGMFLDVLDFAPVFTGDSSLLDTVRVGTHITLLSFLDLYGGFGVDYYSAGFGIHLPGFEIGIAGYEQEGIGATRNSGLSVHASLQF